MHRCDAVSKLSIAVRNWLIYMTAIQNRSQAGWVTLQSSQWQAVYVILTLAALQWEGASVSTQDEFAASLLGRQWGADTSGLRARKICPNRLAFAWPLSLFQELYLKAAALPQDFNADLPADFISDLSGQRSSFTLTRRLSSRVYLIKHELYGSVVMKIDIDEALKEELIARQWNVSRMTQVKSCKAIQRAGLAENYAWWWWHPEQGSESDNLEYKFACILLQSSPDCLSAAEQCLAGHHAGAKWVESTRRDQDAKSADSRHRSWNDHSPGRFSSQSSHHAQIASAAMARTSSGCY